MAHDCILNIAGFDPSSGAGVTADIKTSESHGFYGLGVITGYTFQNHREFEGVYWLSLEKIFGQLHSLLKGNYAIAAIKIGIVPNIETLEEILNWFDLHKIKAPIVWDPVLKSSTGHPLMKIPPWTAAERTISRVNITTPNLWEWRKMRGDQNVEKFPAGPGAIFIKSFKQNGSEISDLLFWKGQKMMFNHPIIKTPGLHGTGCILSTAIACGLARNLDYFSACELGTGAVRNYLKDSGSLTSPAFLQSSPSSPRKSNEELQ